MYLSKEKKKEKRKPICIYRFSNWVEEEQYMVLESLYLQIPLVNIFISIYIYSCGWLKFEVHIFM